MDVCGGRGPIENRGSAGSTIPDRWCPGGSQNRPSEFKLRAREFELSALNSNACYSDKINHDQTSVKRVVNIVAHGREIRSLLHLSSDSHVLRSAKHPGYDGGTNRHCESKGSVGKTTTAVNHSGLLTFPRLPGEDTSFCVVPCVSYMHLDGGSRFCPF